MPECIHLQVSIFTVLLVMGLARSVRVQKHSVYLKMNLFKVSCAERSHESILENILHRGRTSMPDSREPFDIIIIGAGLSGISAAVHLKQRCPEANWCILEGRESMGGTWDLFRYPGVRSDSDMHTLGFSFRPWTSDHAIAEGGEILKYVRDTADHYDITSRVRFGHQVVAADWSDLDQCWHLEVCVDGELSPKMFRCRLLQMCAGYYNYEQPYNPPLTGEASFTGQLLHPQHWPADLDYRNKQVAIIGSGATAVTLAPAMAESASQVTVLQRTPTYIVARPSVDKIAVWLNKLLPDSWAYALVRKKNIVLQQWVYRQSRRKPEQMKRRLLEMTRKELNPDIAVDRHFTPPYYPWDQRLCLSPDADFFRAVNDAKIDMVTDSVDRIVPDGIVTKSGQKISADIIVKATGLNLSLLGDVRFSINGEALDMSHTWTYKGLMFSDVPNLISTFGYINASWTLRADLTAIFLCRLWQHLQIRGAHTCRPVLREEDKSMPARPFIDDFSSGYMQRAMDKMPKQGDHPPWVNTQNYRDDENELRHGNLNDGVLQFL